MRIVSGLAIIALLAPGAEAQAQDYPTGDEPEVRVWLDRGDEPLLQRGDRVRLYYRTSHDAFVAIFRIDTDGMVRLLHPRAPGDETFTRGGRDYRLLFPQSSYWYVDEYPGKGYFFIVASPEPFDLSGFDYVRREGSWDLSRVGRTVYQDPYLAMDDYVARIIPGWETVPYALDFIAYDVGEAHDYPRFLCYDCHGFRSYATWNPYTYACASFRVVVWDDPYYYPAFRYRATRVVYATPRRGLARFEFKERAAGEAWTPLIRTRQPPLRRSAEYVEPGVARPPLRAYQPSPRGGSGALDGRTGTATPRRPSSVVTPPGRSDPGPGGAGPDSPGARAGGGAQPEVGAEPRAQPRRTTPAPTREASPATGGASRERPVLQRRPQAAAPTRPSGGTPARSSAGSRPTPSRGGSAAPSRPARVVTPPRSSGGGAAKPSARTPARPSGGSRPSAAPSRPSTRPAAKPPTRRKPGGG